jgi:hypothetical protein
MLLAVGLTGISQVTARYWLASGSPVSREKASQLISQLAWRGIAKFPISPAK